jgi:hypothetical protein
MSENAGTETGTATETGAGAATTGRTFTEDDVNRIVGERLGKQKAQFRDYDDLKAAKDELDKIKASQQTDAEKAQARADAAEKAVAAATERAVKAEIKAIATGEFADPNDAHLYLGDLSKFIGKDGDVDSDAIEAALKEIEKAKPHLVARARTDAGLGPRGGSQPLNAHQHMNQQIRQAAGR